MATGTSLAWKGGQNAFDSVAASTTDSVLVAGGAGKIIVTAVFFNEGDTTASAVTFNSKGSGSGTAISPPLKTSANGGVVLPYNPAGWFGTVAGEALTVTTGAGSTTGVIVTYSTDS